jgi:hypothetical protein
MNHRFQAPTHVQSLEVFALQEPPAPAGPVLLWKSGAEDARTPNAGAPLDEPRGVARRLECVRFIGAFGPTWVGPWFKVPVRDSVKTFVLAALGGAALLLFRRRN